MLITVLWLRFYYVLSFFFSSRRRHTRSKRDWSSDVCSSNLREDHDTIPDWVFDKEPEFEAFEEGTVKMDRKDMEKAKTMFYEEMGWDTKTGIPTRKTLKRVGLEYMADDLERSEEHTSELQ